MTVAQTTDERLIEQLFDNQPDSVVWFKPLFNTDGSIQDFEVKYCNAAACAILNVPKITLLNHTLLTTPLTDDVSRQRIFEQCCLVWNTGEAMEFTYHSPAHNSYFNVQRSKVQDGILSITRDRTSLVRAELQKEQQSALLNKLIENSPYGVSLYESIRDAEGKIVDFKLKLTNKKSAEITDFTIDELYKYTVKELTEIRGQSAYFDLLVEVVETGKPKLLEHQSKVRGMWLSFSIIKFEDGYLLNYIDVSHTKQLEQHAKEQATMLETVLNTSITGLFAMDAMVDENGVVFDFKIGRINKAFTQILGLTEEQVIGKTYLSLFPTAKASGIYDLHVQVLQTGEPARKEFHFKDGPIDGWFSISISKMGTNALVQSFTNITDLVRSKQELEDKVQELERSNQNLEEFAYAASHDLQEPLRKVTTFLNRIKDNLEPHLDDTSSLYFDRIEASVERMKTLIDDLLQFSHASFKTEAFSKVSLKETVEEVLNDMEVAISEKNAAITIGLLPEVNGIGRQLKQLFQNLIGNALKYAKPGVQPQLSVTSEIKKGIELGNISFRLDTQKTYYVIEVKDNGIGFDQVYAEKIFQLFQRLHGKTEYSGSGVGLAIVKKVVENHNGYIMAEGKLNEGACFKIYLPGD